MDSLMDSLANWEKAAEEAQSPTPKEFIFNGVTYIHVQGTETFKLPDTPLDDDGNPLQTITALQIMKAQFKPTRSYYKRITPTASATIMFKLGDSARFKIMRAVQLHDAAPPVTDETRTFTPFFQFLSTGVEDHWMVQQQYSACKWASPKDEELATSMLLHYGWVQKFPEYKVQDCCIYQMRRADDGIHLTFSYPHTFDDRLQAACVRAQSIAAMFEGRQLHAPYDVLFREACRTFFSYNKYYVSMTSDYRQAIMNKIQAFCLRLTNALGDNNPSYPHIDDPDNLMEIEYDDYDEPKEYLLKWEDFIFEKEVSSVQRAHIARLANDKNVKAILKGFTKLGIDGEYTNDELRAVMGSGVIKKAKDEGLLILSPRSKGRKLYWMLDLDKLNYERS